MDRPEWVPAPAWGRLQAALRGQPQHAHDALADLAAVAAGRGGCDRKLLIEAFLAHAERGAPLPAAFISGLCDLLESDG